ncbi:MAG: sugar ABC transporter permease [Anaerolineaceae bacterium]|nr:sugar ABC transporter permease [Anaerolineaceae bacterium]
MTAQVETLNSPTTPAAPPDVRRRRRIQIGIFVVPAFLFQFFWGWYPLIVALFLSMTDAPLRGAMTFRGLDNYNRLLLDPLVPMAFRVTLIYAGMSILLTFFIPIFVSILLLEMPPRVMRVMMLLWFLPLSGIASTLFWQYLYNEQFGVFQYVATAVLGMPPQSFLSSQDWVLFWLIVPGILLYGPGLYYLTGLQSIPRSYYEAAEIEGAGFWRKIWTISLPRLRPIIAMTLLFAIIGSLQEFAFPDLLTHGGPNGASRTVVMYIMDILNHARYGDATALACLLFALIMIITLIYRVVFQADPDK